MPSRLTRDGARGRRRSAATVVAGTVVVAMLAVAAVAIAKTFTLNVAKNATVTNMTTMVTKHENIAVNGKGFAVYWLSGDSKSPEVHGGERVLQILAAGDGRLGQGSEQGAGDQRQADELEAQWVHPGRARRPPGLHVRA